MTTLVDRLKVDIKAARRARETAKIAFLGLLLSDASKEGKDDGGRDSTDAEVIGTVMEFIKNNNRTLAALGDQKPEERIRLEAEQVILAGYLPRQASADEVRTAVDEHVGALTERNMKQMGVVMGKLTAQFGVNFDKTFASGLVKAALAA